MKRAPTSRFILILLLIVVLAVIAFVFLNHHPKPVATPATAVPEATPLPTPAEWPSTKVSDATDIETGSYYTIHATYPVAKDAIISGYFKTFVENTVAQFKSDTSWAAGSGTSATTSEDGDLSLGITYTEQKNTVADNYIFSIDMFEGGAHDLESTQTFSFTPAGQEITLNSIFTDVDAGLKAVEPYVQAQLSKLADADQSMIAAGTAPTTDNYQNFTVQPDGITFIFDPYEVAPYSDGQQTVKVPLSVFQSLVTPNLFPATQ
jgi:hypothetical protein